MNMRHNKPYNVFGLILSLAYLLISPSLFADTYTYDASGRYSAIKHPNGQVFYYQYDRAGNILSIGTDVVAPAVFSSPVVVNVGSLSNIDITGGNPMGAHTYSATGLPAGLKIDPVTGLITG
jgi:YD repeat-containing protein